MTVISLFSQEIVWNESLESRVHVILQSQNNLLFNIISHFFDISLWPNHNMYWCDIFGLQVKAKKSFIYANNLWKC